MVNGILIRAMDNVIGGNIGLIGLTRLNPLMRGDFRN